MRRRFFFIVFLFICILTSASLIWRVSPSRAQTQECGGRSCADSSAAIGPRQFEFPYYSLRDGFESTVLLVSALPRPLEFILAVHGRSGQTILAPNMTIQPQQKLSVDLAKLLAAEGADILGDFSEGSVSIYFSGTIMPLAGQLTMSNPSRRMIFESEMVDNTPGLGLLPPLLNGIWWGLGGGREASIMVTNTSPETVIADLFFDFLGERHAGPPLEMAPFETKVLSVVTLLGEFETSPAQAPEGGITIVPRGPRPLLVAQGKIVDSATGFSTTLNFLDPSLQRTSALHASGVPIGQPSGGSPYAGLGTFVPHVVVRNLLATPQNVAITVEYPLPQPSDVPQAEEVASEGVFEESATQLAPLAPFTLGPYETRDISLQDAFKLLPLPLPFASIRIEYSGAPGSVTGEVSSIEQKGDLVIDSRLANEGDGWAGSGAHPWHLDEETESILFLTNMGEEECPVGFRIQAKGVTYFLTDLALAPRETQAIDLRKLRDAQEPDLFDNTIPLDATDGSVTWIRLDAKPLMGRLVVLRRKMGTASNYDCDLCCCGAWLTGAGRMTPSGPVTKLVGQTQQYRFDAQYQDCYGGICWYNKTNFPSTVWQSSNTAVATVSTTWPTKGLATAQSGGAASIHAYYYERKYECQPWIGQCVDMGYDVMAVGVTTFQVPEPILSLEPSTVQPNAETTVIVQSFPSYSGLQVSLQRQEVQNTGGHNHLNRPLGTFGASSGTTNAQGRFQTTYRASLFGGQEKIKATMSAKTTSATLNVQISGLTQLTDGANFDLVGTTPYHVLPNNHYGTSAANSDLVAIANDYAALYPGSTLDYNDQSLPKGGLFDIGPPYGTLWNTPHSAHRLGTNCDVRNWTVPPDRWETLVEIFERYGTAVPKSDHWHLTL